MRKGLVATVSALGVVITVAVAHSIPRTPEPMAAPEVEGPMGELIRKLVLESIPHEYEDTRDWGGTKRTWDGLKISTDGLKIQTKRRWKDARHGTWKKYRVRLIDPEEEFHIQLENFQRVPGNRVAFDLIVDAHVGAWGRLSEFRRDVQLISLSVDAEAIVRMKLGCELGAKLGVDKNLTPQVTLQPEITNADLQLVDFELHRVSQINGSVAEQLGKGLHDVLQKEINQRRGKIVEKANRAIKKKEDRLRLSLGDLASSGWGKVMKELGR